MARQHLQPGYRIGETPMKSPAPKKISPRVCHVQPESSLPLRHGGEPDPVFLLTILKAAGVSQKELYNLMGVNKATASDWCSGKKWDFLTRTKHFCDKLRGMNRMDLVSHCLTYISGGYDQ